MPTPHQPHSHTIKRGAHLDTIVIQRINTLHPQPHARKNQHPAPAPGLRLLPLCTDRQCIHQIRPFTGLLMTRRDDFGSVDGAIRCGDDGQSTRREPIRQCPTEMYQPSLPMKNRKPTLT